MNLSKFELDCNACNEYQKEDRGCEIPSSVPGRWQVGEDTYDRCPVTLITQESNWWIRSYNFMEKGILPIQGGWMDQSNKFISAMGLIMGEVSNISKEVKNGK